MTGGRYGVGGTTESAGMRRTALLDAWLALNTNNALRAQRSHALTGTEMIVGRRRYQRLSTAAVFRATDTWVRRLLSFKRGVAFAGGHSGQTGDCPPGCRDDLTGQSIVWVAL